MKFVIRARIVLAAILLVSPTIATLAQDQSENPVSPPIDQAELLKRLQEGGLVLLIRHERTEVPSRSDDYTRPSNDCRAQRNLSIAGAAGARETGIVLRALEIDVDRVISSPMCRSAETARFMFGVSYETDARLMHHDPNPESGRDLDAAEAELRELLTELAPGIEGTNIALISHGGNILRVSGLRISEGEIGVLELTEDGSINALGHLMGSDLAPYARRKLAQEAEANR